MIQEDDLRRLLAEAAESIPPPGGAPDALLAELAAQRAALPSRHRGSTGVRWAAVAASVVVVIALGATLSSNGSDSSTSDSSAAFGGNSTATTSAAAETDASGEGGQKVPVPDAAQLGDLSFGAAGAPAASAASAGGSQPAPPLDSAKIIKTGSLDLEVRAGAFDGTVDRISAQAVGLGGYVAESTTSESGDAPSGSITVRVPAGSFETLLTDLRRLGDVKSVSSKGTDVTAQFTDLAARLTALTATRDRLATVLSKAANVPDILAVQDRITGVQTEIEQLQGQQRLLDDQASFATLAITVGEPGAEIVKTDAEPDKGLGQAWDDARHRFGDSLESIVSWSGSAVVVLLVLLVLLAVSRLVWVGVRRRIV